MKLFLSAITAALLSSSAFANEDGCVASVEEGRDYFPHKVEVEYSQYWTVSYEDTYKIVTDTAIGESYLLYQCGTEPPADTSQYAGVFSVPFPDVALQYTTMLPFFEILGARQNIAALLSSAQFVTSPCMAELFDAGAVEEVDSPFNTTSITNVPLDVPAFVGFGGGTAFPNEIHVSVASEGTNLASFEWIKYYALFMNLEERANEIFSEVAGRFACATENANVLACDNEQQPVVLWGYYSTFCNGWDVARCPNYYCDMAQRCSSELLFDNDRVCNENSMTTEEFVEFGKDADVWIFASSDFDNVFAEFGDDLMNMKSVQNQQVYDTEGSGAGTWFSQRLAEPDVLLQDFCNLVGHENLDIPNPHTRQWFRNVFTEPVGSLGGCEDVDAPLDTRATQCFPLPANACATLADPATDAPATGDEESSAPKLGALCALIMVGLASLII